MNPGKMACIRPILAPNWSWHHSDRGGPGRIEWPPLGETGGAVGLKLISAWWTTLLVEWF